VVVSVDLFGHDYDGVAAIGRFWDEKNDCEHEDTKKDGAHAEGPSVAIVLDDVAAHQSASRNSGEKKEVPHRNSRSSFVNKGEISNGTLDQDFVGRHTNSTNYATREERVILLGRSAPNATYKRDDNGEDEDGAFAPNLGQWIEDK
jgi:hypothetical protein